ncbi:MAG: hypothetical protein CM15mV3_2270 [Caudoviricetes sp.]|nr:MAG: hypothetical protein CM15mV3_2270 [Caudoviricetes sp.]
MTGSVRSWIHYIELRSANGTQKEHMDIALDASVCLQNSSLFVRRHLGWYEILTLEDYQKAGETF